MHPVLLAWRDDAPAKAFGFHQSQGASGEPELVVDKSESHILVNGPSGSGKSMLALANLLHWPGSALALDIKGELTNVSAGWREAALGHDIVALDPWGKSQRKAATFNPFDVLLRVGYDDLIDCAFGLASMLAGKRPDGSNEGFWYDRGVQLNAGAIVDIATSTDFGEHSIRDLWQLLHADDVVYALAVRLDTKELHPFARAVYSQFCATVEVTRSGILSTAQSHLTYFAGPAVQRALARTSFDLEAFATGGPISIYLVIPVERLKSHVPVIRLLLSALMTLVTSREHRPETPTLLVLDEAAQLGDMPQIQDMVTLGRGYGCRAMLMVQNVQQLRECYPASYRTIMSNCGATVVLPPNYLTEAVEAAEALGDISAEAIHHMGLDRVAVKMRGQNTFVARQLNYRTDTMFKGRFASNPLYETPRPAAKRPAKRTARPRDAPPETGGGSSDPKNKAKGR